MNINYTFKKSQIETETEILMSMLFYKAYIK